MNKIITPARVAAALGVLTGLGTAITALEGAFPVGQVPAAVTAASGVLGSAVVFVQWLKGQSAWETTQLAYDGIVDNQPAAELTTPEPEPINNELNTGLDPDTNPEHAGAPDSAAPQS